MNFDVFLKTTKIRPVKISGNELAWSIEDIPYVLDYIFSQNKIILGGDILTSSMVYNYDSWYYNPNVDSTHSYNSKKSYNKAIDYVKKYVKSNGKEYYVVIVFE